MNEQEQMDQEEGLKLLDLNDDCLTEICKFLKFEDLCHLYEANKAFGAAIGNALQSSDAGIWFTMDLRFNPHNKNIKSFLDVFGNKIKFLKIATWKQVCEDVIEAYFAGGNVKSCVLSFTSKLTKEFVSNHWIFFKSLKHLEIKSFHIQNYNLQKLLDAITDIETFEIVFNFRYNINDICLSKLLLTPVTKLDLKQLKYLPEEEINNLCDNTSVKYLCLAATPQNFRILRHFKAVESLELYYEELFASPSLEIKMKDLKYLKITCKKHLAARLKSFLNELRVLKTENSIIIYFSK